MKRVNQCSVESHEFFPGTSVSFPLNINPTYSAHVSNDAQYISISKEYLTSY